MLRSMVIPNLVYDDTGDAYITIYKQDFDFTDVDYLIYFYEISGNVHHFKLRVGGVELFDKAAAGSGSDIIDVTSYTGKLTIDILAKGTAGNTMAVDSFMLWSKEA
jgi:hypothetical protein